VVILGLTGSIGMGKTTAARAFRQHGVPVHDADRAVYALLAERGPARAAIVRLFPEAAPEGRIDRRALGARVFGDPAALAALEAILHPAVFARERRFLASCARRGVPLAVLDIPLLFETGSERHCDAVMVVSAPRAIQRARVLARPGMSEARFADILARQMADREKRRRADFVVETGQSRGASLRQIAEIVRVASAWPGQVWSPRYAAQGRLGGRRIRRRGLARNRP